MEREKLALLFVAMVLVPSCAQDIHRVLGASTHAFGTAHLEGPLTDSQADMTLLKVPEYWTPEQVDAFIRLRAVP